MNRLGLWVAGVAVLVGVVNVVLFAVWWNMIEVTADMPASERGYTIETLALNVTFLEIVITVVAFGVAVVGILGYVEIKNAAVSASVTAAVGAAKDVAEREARSEANEQMVKFIREQERARISEQTETSGSYTVEQSSPDSDIQRAGEGE